MIIVQRRLLGHMHVGIIQLFGNTLQFLQVPATDFVQQCFTTGGSRTAAGQRHYLCRAANPR